MRHPVKCRRQLRVDHIAAESLSGDKDHIIALKHAGVFILPCGNDRIKIFTQPFRVAAGCVLRIVFQIDIQYIIRIIRLRLRFRCHIFFCIRVLFAGDGFGSRVTDFSPVCLGNAEYLIPDIDPEHGDHPKLFHLIVCIGIRPVQH